jgi:hypothetical protein
MLHQWDGIDVWGHTGGTLTSGSVMYVFPGLRGVLTAVVNTPAAVGPFLLGAIPQIIETVFGVRPTVLTVNPQRRQQDPARFVGTYTSMGISLDIARDDDETLLATVRHHRTEDELAAHEGMPTGEMAVRLVPLDDDRFALQPRELRTADGASQDVAFSGHDSFARATNMTFGPAALRKVKA